MKKQPSALFLEKQKGVFYSPKANPVSIAFSTDVVKNGEIVDKHKFQTLLLGKIIGEKSEIEKLLIILGTTLTYEKEIVSADGQIEKEAFLEMVPYERILSREFRLKKAEFIVATNSDFCEEVMDIAETEGISIIGIVPFSVMQKVLVEMKKEFNSTIALEKIDMLASYSLIYFETKGEKKITFTFPDNKNRRFIASVGIFITLLIILIFMIITQLNSPQTVTSPKHKTLPHQVVVPSETSTPSSQIEPSKSVIPSIPGAK